jgi:hypothetical protein
MGATCLSVKNASPFPAPLDPSTFYGACELENTIKANKQLTMSFELLFGTVGHSSYVYC